MRLDLRNAFPQDMEQYLEFYGWHFSKKMCEWACSKMYKEINGRREFIKPYSKDEVDQLLEKQNIKIFKPGGYDYIYVANMAKADFFGSSISDEAHLARFIKDYCDDPDAPEGMPFTRYYADCIASGTPIIWSDML